MLPVLPLTDSGKIDKRRLRALLEVRITRGDAWAAPEGADQARESAMAAPDSSGIVGARVERRLRTNGEASMVRIISHARIAISLGTIAAFAVAPATHAFEEYDPLIPHLDDAGGCEGLCHATGFASSPLYLDFQAAGFVWNATMASADSDDDGFSNGWELQNPSGDWMSGTPYPGSAALVSNPALSASLPPLPVATVPTAIVHQEAAGQNGSEAFAVQNVGALPFDYSISSSDTWMTPDPPSAVALPASQQDEILVLFATDGLGDGLYAGDLTIAIPGIRDDRIPAIPVDLTVPEPGAVTAVAGVLAGLGLLAQRRSGRRARRQSTSPTLMRVRADLLGCFSLAKRPRRRDRATADTASKQTGPPGT